jgi:MoxR-like ATPase
VAPVPPQPAADARADAPLPPNLRPRPRIEVPDVLPLAFGACLGAAADTTAAPYAIARVHLDLLLDMVAARATVAIAQAWNSGRLSQPNATPRPSELEVLALDGRSGGFAGDQLLEARGRLALRQRAAGELVAETAAAGSHLPFPALIRELGLSALAAQILLVVAAPLLRGEIARLYGVLSNDPARPLVDRFLIDQLIAGDNSARRDDIARELANDAALVRNGLIQIDAAPIPLFARLVVPDTLLDHLRGFGPVRRDDIAQVRCADTPLDRLLIPSEVKRKLVLALAEPAPPHAQVRVVVRGRRGTGRHSLIAAVAARLGRDIVAIDTTRFPRGRRELLALLRAALFRASLHGLVPVLSGLEAIEHTDIDVCDAVRQVLRNHPGPICIATSPEATLPIDPGFVAIDLPPLLELERAGAWARLAGDAGLTADADQLAARYRIGPGIISRAIRNLAAEAGCKGDATAALDNQVRQYVAARLDHVARRVERTAHWEDVALPEEILDSLREFISRARHRRTVYEEWGYDAKMTTSRGLTALFYGPPGTGKTMVAGVIAQELGLDMYRVDLARIVSKWVGETEKNLAEVFDAAEDGQVLILFDEADSLFAKRTDVRTSNDRYANLEVNYLLQRLDTFEGVAILTSNLDGAIDPAFKRRLSLRLQFPFPDEETRVRLWTSHVTAETPVAGDFDFSDLARRFPLSGGYIRNCALRAAFLAAHEGRPLAQSHLVRAIHLEYREIGKLSTTSRLE